MAKAFDDVMEANYRIRLRDEMAMAALGSIASSCLWQSGQPTRWPIR